MVQCSQRLARTRQLSAIATEITAYAEKALPLISVTRPNYACQSSYNSWWLHVQLHEATPTDFALVHKAYILQMHSPSIDSIYVGRCILSMVVVAGVVTTWPFPPIPWPNSRGGKDLWLMQITYGYELIANATSVMSSYLQSLPVPVKWWSPRCSCCWVLPVSTKMVWMLCWRLLKSTRWVLPLNLFCAVFL